MNQNLSGVKVLVTGGAGFIGSHTVDAFVERGANVVVVDNLSTGDRRNLHPDAVFHQVNIRDPKIGEIVAAERPRFIYHFAYFVLVPKSVENPMLDLDAIEGSLRILQAAKETGARKIIFASSGFLYGNAVRLPAGEHAAIDPLSPYVVSKHAVENYLRFYRRAFSLPSVILRYSAVYGPRQVTGAMADYIRKLAAGRQAEIWGDGTKTRDYVFIDDVVRANLLALQVPDDHPDPTYNIASGIETPLNEVYSRIAGMLGKTARPNYLPDRPGEQMRYCLDSTKARRELGWAPRIPLDEGLQITVRALTS